MTTSNIPTILLVHDDRDLLEILAVVMDNQGYAVFVARSGPAAVAFLRAGSKVDVVVSNWDVGHGVGQSLYAWIQENRIELSSSFVALASFFHSGVSRSGQGGCQLCDASDLAAIMSSVRGVLSRVNGHAETQTSRCRSPRPRPREIYCHPETSGFRLASRTIEPDKRPSLLLIEDEPLQRDVMTDALDRVGFSVTGKDSGKAAMSSLERGDYDVILSDWYMEDGSGAELYSWLVDHRPHLAERCVFMSARTLEDDLADEFSQVAPRRPFVCKADGTNALLGYLTGIAARSRDGFLGYMSLGR